MTVWVITDRCVGADECLFAAPDVVDHSAAVRSYFLGPFDKHQEQTLGAVFQQPTGDAELRANGHGR
jgi:ferredoxin